MIRFLINTFFKHGEKLHNHSSSNKKNTSPVFSNQRGAVVALSRLEREFTV